VCVTSKVRVEGTSGFQPPKSPYTPAGLVSYLADTRFSHLDPDPGPGGAAESPSHPGYPVGASSSMNP
ncbi:MAG: hypothetical protein QOK15_1266, partial [Nocardioidaceae bacterium]|nr:hypothetical protein [Nocardioidaceae bacterium]